MGSHRLHVVALVLAASAVVFGIAACVLADPPAGLPPTTIQAPHIDREAVVPPVTQVLEAWPKQGFDIPLDPYDPSVAVYWQAFYDYAVMQAAPVERGVLDPNPAADSGTRRFHTDLPPPADVQDCHIIEILVAHAFVDIHTPDSYGGDSVSWIYAPNGSLDLCPVFDAGLPDAAKEGGGD
ncbi:MAG TPA: hypothetical protein VGI39_40770 [Polyangiaceae bacterium]|jgi:hypothetical protein